MEQTAKTWCTLQSHFLNDLVGFSVGKIVGCSKFVMGVTKELEMFLGVPPVLVILFVFLFS